MKIRDTRPRYDIELISGLRVLRRLTGRRGTVVRVMVMGQPMWGIHWDEPVQSSRDADVTCSDDPDWWKETEVFE